MSRAVMTDAQFVSEMTANMRNRWCWPARWVSCAGGGHPPVVCAYRLRFALEHSAAVRIHVSADERYELYLDGRRIGRGPERGDRLNWFFESYHLDLTAGSHLLVARVWSLGTWAALAQLSVGPAFMVSAEEPFLKLLSTGLADWQAKILEGYDYQPGPFYGFVGPMFTIDAGKFPFGFERGEGDGWQPVLSGDLASGGAVDWGYLPARVLRPSLLPAMHQAPAPPGVVRHVSQAPDAEGRHEDVAARQPQPVLQAEHLQDETSSWQNLLDGQTSLIVPPHTLRRVLIELPDYYCAYPSLVVSGGAGGRIRLSWAEALYEEPGTHRKGHRGRIEGKHFVGFGDVFLPDGGDDRRFETLWWRAGRFLELTISTAEQPLTLQRFNLEETRYPLSMHARFACSDSRLEAVIPIALRALRMCSHETYMDCPYYEQLMYVGDARLEALTHLVISRDHRLPIKAVSLFDASRLPSGLTQSRYPTRLGQIIPPFSLWWVGMVYDLALWRGERKMIERLMPGVRSVIDAYRCFLNERGLIDRPHGWNFVDWVPTWECGVPPEGQSGVNSILNWHFLLILRLVEQLETWLGETGLAERVGRWAGDLEPRCREAFWDEDRGLFADDLAHQHYSEHAQCLAILSGALTPDQESALVERMLATDGLARTTVYFNHYLFEVFRRVGRMDALFDRLQLWFDFLELGCKTTPEMPEPSRSDCHAWGAHPIYHCLASILGVRPAGLGFERVVIQPQLGPLTRAAGSLVHPAGMIEAQFSVESGRIHGSVSLPPGLSGTLLLPDGAIALNSGPQSF